MASSLTVAGARAPARTTVLHRTRILAVPEVRWAALSTVAFVMAAVTQVVGAPAWLWIPLYIACYMAGGWEPALAGLRALQEKTLDVDLLMIVAALGAAAIGQVLDGGLLIVIFATSGALEAVATARTADSVKGLLDLAPDKATRLIDDGTDEVVAAGDLRVGDIILVRPGERIGADGTVVDGASEVDQATITGEPLAVSTVEGDAVFASTLNGTGVLRIRVDTDPSESVIARIVSMVEDASATKAPTQLFIEKVEQRYSVGVVVATLAIFGIPLLFGADLNDALLRAMTFMIVASPCAVVLATMPPLLSAIATAGRNGVLVKSAVVMERLAEITQVAMDKTGTLTEGTPRVAEIRPLADLDADRVLMLAAAVEHLSEHPIGSAVVSAARERGLSLGAAVDFEATPGHGVAATVDGVRVEVGSPVRLLHNISQVSDVEGTAVVVLADGVPIGVLGIIDNIRAEAAVSVAALAQLTGTAPVLLTGDNPRTAADVAGKVGITDIRAGLLPGDKVDAVTEFQRGGHRVLVVGDGINDAPALASAHVGVAMGRAGSDLALETADAVVVHDDLSTIPAVLSLSRRARRLVVQNLVIAGTFITVLVTWDLVGHLPLPLGVAGHEGSTILVALNGLRLLRNSAWRAKPSL